MGYQERMQDLTDRIAYGDTFGLGDFRQGGQYDAENRLQRMRSLGLLDPVSAQAPSVMQAQRYLDSIRNPMASQQAFQQGNAIQQMLSGGRMNPAAAAQVASNSAANTDVTGAMAGTYNNALSNLFQQSNLNAGFQMENQGRGLGVYAQGLQDQMGIGSMAAERFLSLTEMQMQQRAAERAAKRAAMGQALGALGGIAGMALGGPLGGMIGGKLFGMAGPQGGGAGINTLGGAGQSPMGWGQMNRRNFINDDYEFQM